MNKKKDSILVFAAIFVISLLIIMISCSNLRSQQTDNIVNTAGEDPEALEIPLFTISRTGQTIEHCAYTVSYNEQWRIPNWVAYELTRKEASGTLPRGHFFVPDPNVKGATAQYYDYKESGYDHGHMAPAGDMKWDQQAMDECFYLSNICPQDHDLNNGDWRLLEERIREWALKYGNIYIVCGPIVGENPKTIGSHKVAVPDGFFKVLLCRIEGKWQALGFYFENQPGHHALTHYCKSVDEIEHLTGMDFFAPLEDNIEDTIEATYDMQAWGLRK